MPAPPSKSPQEELSDADGGGANAAAERFIRGRPYSDAFLNGVRYDYASMGAGARLVTQAKDMKNAKAILSSDKTEYMLVSCRARTWFVVSLLEDLFLEQIGLISLELFASGFRHVQILGSRHFPTEVWRVLGEIESNASAPYELFDVGARCRRQPDSCWVRYIKVRVLSHHDMDDNSFCALTRFQAFGSTQMTYIAEEGPEADHIDHRVEPSLADISQWHDVAVEAARAAVSGLVEDETLQATPRARSAWPSGGVSEEPAVHAETLEGSNSPVLYRPRAKLTPLHEQPLAYLQQALSWIRDRTLPRPALADDGPDGGEAGGEGAGSGAGAGPGGDGAERRAEEILSELNATSALSSLERSLSRLSASLGGDAPAELAGGAGAAGSAGVGGGGGAGAATAKPNKTSSNVPPVVKLHNDLRDVQTVQATLKEDLRSVTSVLRETLVLMLQVAVEKNRRPAMARDEHGADGEAFDQETTMPHHRHAEEVFEALRFMAQVSSDNASCGPWVLLGLMLLWNIRLEILLRRQTAESYPVVEVHQAIEDGPSPTANAAAVATAALRAQRSTFRLWGASPMRDGTHLSPPLELGDPGARLRSSGVVGGGGEPPHPLGQAAAERMAERRRPSRGFARPPPLSAVSSGVNLAVEMQRSSSCSSSERDGGRRRRHRPNVSADEVCQPTSPTTNHAMGSYFLTSDFSSAPPSDAEETRKAAAVASWFGYPQSASDGGERSGHQPRPAHPSHAGSALSTSTVPAGGQAGGAKVPPAPPLPSPVASATPSAAGLPPRRAPKRFSSTARRHIKAQFRRERDSGASG